MNSKIFFSEKPRKKLFRDRTGKEVRMPMTEESEDLLSNLMFNIDYSLRRFGKIKLTAYIKPDYVYYKINGYGIGWRRKELPSVTKPKK